jgi:hypothetical protein
MAGNVNITSKGIQKVLRHYSAKQAIAEYIWNGFDAGANAIHLNYSYDELGNIDSFSIADNGKGIDLDNIKSKFNPFYDSEKAVPFSVPKHTSLMHGKNGVGRLTFFTFARSAKWETVFQNNAGKLYAGCIQVAISGLNSYETFMQEPDGTATTGTTVSFQQINITKEAIDAEVLPFLVSEFCWFLELQKDKGYRIYVNGIVLDHDQNIEHAEEGIEIFYEKTDTLFKVKFIQWQKPLNKELSKYYFLNEKKEEVYKDYTTLNKKCDEFYHSVYIQSEFFNNFDFKSTEDQLQTDIFGKAKSSPEYKYLIKNINDYLKAQRKPYLRAHAAKLMEQYEQEMILPLYKTADEEINKKPRLEKVLTALYEAQPKLFSNMNLEQKKLTIRMIALMLDSNQKENLFSLINGIIDLEPEEQKELTQLICRKASLVPYEHY